MKTVEELLLPRYKCIAPYPCSDFTVGDTIEFKERIHPFDGSTELAWVTKWIGESKYFEYYFSQFPHLFQPLPWWSDRKVEDMPEYLHCPSRGTFHKVDEWQKASFITDGRTKKQLANYLPATREEYEAFKQQKEG